MRLSPDRPTDTESSELEGNLDAWLAFVFSVVVAAAVAAGVGVHRIRARTR